jgi:hypothetical protein
MKGEWNEGRRVRWMEGGGRDGRREGGGMDGLVFEHD